MSTADAALIALGEKFEIRLLEYMDAWLAWAPLMRAARAEAESDLAGFSLAIQRTGCEAAQTRMSELESGMQLLAEEIITAPATSLGALRAKALVAPVSAFHHGAFEFRDDGGDASRSLFDAVAEMTTLMPLVRELEARLAARAAKQITATTRTTAIPMMNGSYNSIRSPPPLTLETEPLASLKFHVAIASRMATMGSLLANFERAGVVSGSRHPGKSLGNSSVPNVTSRLRYSHRDGLDRDPRPPRERQGFSPSPGGGSAVASSCGDRKIAMSDDPKKRGSQDRSRINTHEDYEVRYWSKKFGVSPDQLKAAVKKVGNSVAAVQQELSH